MVEENLHVGINVKDFKAITNHAETLKTSITALYSFPSRPMQLSYHEHGMRCDFTLMTIGDYWEDSIPSGPGPSRRDAAAPPLKPPFRQQSALSSVEHNKTTMQPPTQSASRSLFKEPLAIPPTRRPSPPPPKASLDPESLFLSHYDDEDRQWGERSYEEEEDTVGWSATAFSVNHLCFPLCKPRADIFVDQKFQRLSRWRSVHLETPAISVADFRGPGSPAANAATIAGTSTNNALAWDGADLLRSGTFSGSEGYPEIDRNRVGLSIARM